MQDTPINPPTNPTVVAQDQYINEHNRISPKLPKGFMDYEMFQDFINKVAVLYKNGESWASISKILRVSLFKLRDVRYRFKDELQQAIASIKDVKPSGNATLEEYNLISSTNTSSKDVLCKVLDDIVHNHSETSANRTTAVKLLSELKGFNVQENAEIPQYRIQFVSLNIPIKTPTNRTLELNRSISESTKAGMSDLKTPNIVSDSNVSSISSPPVSSPISNTTEHTVVVDGDTNVDLAGNMFE